MIFGMSMVKSLKKTLSQIKNNILDKRACFYLNKVNNDHSHGEAIKVGFIVQMPELWDKQSDVYESMCKSALFEPWLIIVPKYCIQNNSISEYGDEKAYYIDQCKNGKILLAREDNKWIDLEAHGFDYIFFQRPYDSYLPKKLRSYRTVRFTKNCYIPYAVNVTGAKNTIAPRSFFRNLYFGFLESESEVIENNHRFAKNSDDKVRHFVNIGYPCFETCLKINTVCNYKCFMWTPRWSYEPIIGGSHFIEYYNQLSNYDWKENKLIVRPHPLMWDNFIRNGILTKEKTEQILQMWSSKAIQTDKNKTVEESFGNTDVLISDRSSVIIMFFLTGKPIIYCPMEGEYDYLFSLILPGLYIADSWDDLEKNIKMLSSGEDPLKEKRKEIIDKYFSQHMKATENILTAIVDDSRKRLL